MMQVKLLKRVYRSFSIGETHMIGLSGLRRSFPNLPCLMKTFPAAGIIFHVTKPAMIDIHIDTAIGLCISDSANAVGIDVIPIVFNIYFFQTTKTRSEAFKRRLGSGLV
jgi:hypothetical protein